MSESAIRQKIFETLSAVPNVGKVHDFERWAVDWGKFIEFFKHSSGRILGWEICRAGMQSEKIDVIEEDRTHGFVIKGYMAVKDADATEKLFNAHIEAICDAFKGNHTLGGVCLDAGPVQVEVIDTRMFGSVLCHYAELKIPVNEIV
ncbi:MAG: hypothetical protein CVU59_05030 [Deltaproteobacteria bacterium HGW-Deltaproteobacteria-17]|jgi:hypothetical protein|nr:MAG: hypothetical protein CVU59_05030 [Deltaproteobacteria bacterium HGW-Deltaproteobacteria-17]